MSVVASKVETDEKFRAYFQSRDRRVRDELVEAHFPLGRMLASRYRGGSEPFDDLVQVASIGLMKAVERFDPGYGTSFSTFATPTIIGELKRHLRDRTWSFHVSRRDKDLRLEVRAATEEVQHQLHHAEPSVGDIARHAGLSERDTLRGQLALSLYNSKAVDPSATESELGGDEEGFERVEARIVMRKLAAELPPVERDIFTAYYIHGRSQADIAGQLGRSQMFVSRELSRSRETLRARVADQHGVAVDTAPRRRRTA
jgi:RNA polymerase sigma-B factor